MNILVVNCGSSSQNFKVYHASESGEVEIILSGKAQNVATTTRGGGRIEWQVSGEIQVKDIDLPTHQHAAREYIQILRQSSVNLDAIGNRFVHGGTWLTETMLVTEDSLKMLEKCLHLAPIHNPNSLSVVQVYRDEYPQVPQFVVFDTQFHAHLPDAARRYALPQDMVDRFGFLKYGFHGLSYQFVSAKSAELLDVPLDDVKLIMCHLGTGGSSVAAFKNGHTVDTSMGYSPLPGLVMSTRCGDLDPEIVLELMRQGYTVDEVSQILNTQSGLIGLSEYSSNLSEVIEAAGAGNQRCEMAVEVYANRLKHYIGAYFWQMNGADAIVFTDEVGTHCSKLREKVCGDVSQLGVILDSSANAAAKTDRPQFLHANNSNVKILSMPTDEEKVILEEVCKNFIL